MDSMSRLAPIGMMKTVKARNLLKYFQLMAWSRYQRLASSEHRLRYLFWESTLACNLTCRHCGSDCSASRNIVSELTTNEAISAFESIASRYTPDQIMIAVTGGEPLVRKDLFAVTERISALGFPWGMVTNGFAMTKERARECRRTGMRTATVSIDGLKDDHNWLRGSDSSFDKALGGVRSLADEAFLSNLQVATTVSGRTIDKLPDIYEFVAKEPVDGWRLITLFPGGRAKDNRDLLMRPDDYRKLYTFVKDLRKSNPRIEVTVDEEGYLGCDFEREVRDSYYACPAGIEVGSILANGDISACPSISRRLVQGNIRSETFADCWENKFQPFRDRRWMRQGMCESCNQWWICKSNGLHLWDFERNEPAVCHYKNLHMREERA